MKAVNIAFRWVLGISLVAGFSTLPRIKTGTIPDHAGLRVALRTAEGSFELCRKPSAQELENLPMHMRRLKMCEVFNIPYTLAVSRNGTLIFSEGYSATGIHSDRPITVDKLLEIPVGNQEIEVRFEPDAEGLANLPEDSKMRPESYYSKAILHFEQGGIRIATLGNNGQLVLK